MKARNIVLAIATTLVLALGISPALAQQGQPQQDGRELVARGKGKQPKFPMQAKRFKALVAMRLQKASDKLEARLQKRGVPPAQAAKIQAKFKQGAVQLGHAVDKAASDGMISQKEAKKLRQLTGKLRKQAAGKLENKAKRGKANPAGKGKAKAKAKAKAKGHKQSPNKQPSMNKRPTSQPPAQ